MRSVPMKAFGLKLRRVALTAAVLAMALPGRAGAAALDIEPVSEETLAIMTPEAREAYDLALDYLDHILYAQSLQEAREAARLTPTSIELQYFCIDLAEYLARTSYGQEAQRYFDIILEHLNTILELPRLAPRQRQRAEFDLQKYQEARANVFRRDELRRSWGAEFATEFSQRVFDDEDEDPLREDPLKRLQEAVQTVEEVQFGTATAAETAAEALAETAEEDYGEPAGAIEEEDEFNAGSADVVPGRTVDNIVGADAVVNVTGEPDEDEVIDLEAQLEAQNAAEDDTDSTP